MASEELNPQIPPDPKRCQTEVTTYNAFIMGGDVRKHTRCSNEAGWLLAEKIAGADGRVGAMTVCDVCVVKAKEKFGNLVIYARIEEPK